MLRNLSLRTLNLLLLGVVASGAVLLTGVIGYTIGNVRLIQSNWQNYDSDRSEKARLVRLLRKSLGYGGLIHDFKNFVIRHDDQYWRQTLRDIGAARAILGQYQSIPLSDAEQVALVDIDAVVREYDGALGLGRMLVRDGRSAAQIDEIARVADADALRALDILEAQAGSNRGEGEGTIRFKSRLAGDLYAELGYGGLIHAFKDYVIRHDPAAVEAIQRHVENVQARVDAYRQLPTTPEEQAALHGVIEAVGLFQSRVPTVTSMIEQGATVEQIDRAIAVGDAGGLFALTNLDREISKQIDQSARILAEHLSDISSTIPALNWSILCFLVLAVILSGVIFNRVFISPIYATISLLDRLVKDDVAVEVPNLTQDNEIGKLARAVEAFRQDIIRRQAVEEELFELAVTDPLTGIGNRKKFHEFLEDGIRMAARSEIGLGCLLIDLDGFKPVNDRHGHAAGDLVLKEVSRRLTALCRETDLVARLGGDEFAIVVRTKEMVPKLDLLAERVLEQIQLPIAFGNSELRVGASLGIALYPANGKSAETLLNSADVALYAAKGGGRGSYRLAEG